jgi:GTP cyclohydrolase II
MRSGWPSFDGCLRRRDRTSSLRRRARVCWGLRLPDRWACPSAGLDTLDANTTLGFDDDERDYGIAARMLHMLGCTRVLLLTNNPAKLDGLARTGIEVSGRIALHVAVNADNRRYLTAKATRAGHALDPLFAAVAQRRARRR